MNELDEQPLRDAFDRLQRDADRVDTLAALRNVQHPGANVPGRVLALGALSAIALVLGLVFLTDDDGSDVFAGQPDTTENPDSVPDDDAAGLAGVVGTSWVLISGNGATGPVPLVDGWPITLTFQDGALGGTAACNGYGGDYTILGETIAIGELVSNAMGCEEEVMASEAAFQAALRAANTIAIADGRLRLRGPDVELLFEPQLPVPVAELVGQLWRLEMLIEGETSTSVGGDPATLLLDAEGNVSGSTGCRSFSGSYIVNGGSVLFPDFGMEGECPAQLATQDGLVVTVLGDGFTAQIDGDRLTLSSVGNEGLGYVAVSEDDVDAGVETEPIGLIELLDTRPEGEVEVSGHLVDAGGGWFLCEQPDPTTFHRCSGRWLVLTYLPDDIIRQFGPNDLSDEIGTWRASEEPVTVLGHLRSDDRFELTGSEGLAEPTEAEADLLDAFIGVDATAPDVGALRLSEDGVTIALANQLVVERTRAQLADPAQWRLDSEAFRGRVGPFSALDALGAAGNISTIVGPHSHCASPPTPIAEQFRGARQLSIQPTGIDSCLLWWTVDLFVDDQGDVIGVVFDTWEP